MVQAEGTAGQSPEADMPDVREEDRGGCRPRTPQAVARALVVSVSKVGGTRCWAEVASVCPPGLSGRISLSCTFADLVAWNRPWWVYIQHGY